MAAAVSATTSQEGRKFSMVEAWEFEPRHCNHNTNNSHCHSLARVAAVRSAARIEGRLTFI
jgi:hypothetical protein